MKNFGAISSLIEMFMLNWRSDFTGVIRIERKAVTYSLGQLIAMCGFIGILVGISVFLLIQRGDIIVQGSNTREVLLLEWTLIIGLSVVSFFVLFIPSYIHEKNYKIKYQSVIIDKNFGIIKMIRVMGEKEHAMVAPFEETRIKIDYPYLKIVRFEDEVDDEFSMVISPLDLRKLLLVVPKPDKIFWGPPILDIKEKVMRLFSGEVIRVDSKSSPFLFSKLLRVVGDLVGFIGFLFISNLAIDLGKIEVLSLTLPMLILIGYRLVEDYSYIFGANKYLYSLMKLKGDKLLINIGGLTYKIIYEEIEEVYLIKGSKEENTFIIVYHKQAEPVEINTRPDASEEIYSILKIIKELKPIKG